MLRKGTVDRNDKVTFSTLTKTLNKLAKLRRHVSRVQFTKINFGKMSETRNLKRRMKKHTGKKSYRCFQCDQLFSQPSSLRLHLKSHTGDKPNQYTMGLSPCKMGNREFVSDYHHRPHFLEIQLFQTELFGDCQLRSFTFELYLGTS